MDCTPCYSLDSLLQSSFVGKKAQSCLIVVIGVERSSSKDDVDVVDDGDGRNGSLIDFPFLVGLIREEQFGMDGGRWILLLVVFDREDSGRGLGHSAMIHRERGQVSPRTYRHLD